MKQNTTNEWKDGLNLDLHPIVTPNTVLTDNLNGTFITYNGNEFCLQNDRGNRQVASLTSGYTPIGIKEHNGILYIVSVKGNKTEIGTFPSPQYPETWTDNLYETSNDLIDDYAPLHVLNNHQPLTEQILEYDTKHPVTIEIQDSYDGSVNLIIVANGCKPRIINSGFSILPNNQYKFVNRKQSVDTNIYNEDIFDKDTELIRTSDILTNIDLLGVKEGGQFKGGNYTFYIKFGDADYNQTDVVAESGIVSIFNGNDGVPSTISGTLSDERTDKMINLRITGFNHANLKPVYSKIYIYYSREYSDTQGYRMTEYGMFNEPIDTNPVYMLETIDASSGRLIYTEFPEGVQDIWLTGFEQIVPINSEELNVDYHTIDSARAEVQHSNMLFLGNVGQQETFKLYEELRNFAENITVSEYTSKTLEQVDYDYKLGGTEYYSTSNIYHWVGYYPNEIYRFGVVFILKDGSKTPVFNVRGNVAINNKYNHGVFKTSDHKVITSDSINLIGLTFNLPNDVLPDDVIGWFAVRQKRIPNTICEGLSIAIDKKSNIPVIYDGENWITQSFISHPRDLEELKSQNERENPNVSQLNCKLEYNYGSEKENDFSEKTLREYGNIGYWKEANALLSLDPCVNSSIASMFDGSEFDICLERFLNAEKENNDVKIQYKIDDRFVPINWRAKSLYIPSNTGVKVIDNYEFSNVAGNAADVSQFKYFTFPSGIFEHALIPRLCGEGEVWRNNLFITLINNKDRLPLSGCVADYDYLYKTNLNINILRGLYTPYIGFADRDELPLGIYSMKHKSSFDESDYLVRKQDNSEYYCISEYFNISDKLKTVFRGDCYTNTVTIRIIRNFIDATAPVNDVIIQGDGWQKYVIEKDMNSTDDKRRLDYHEVNLSDVNTVDLGLWATFKCLSSYNLGLRSVDRFHEDEMALLGSPRTFYPLNGASTATGHKMEESYILNDGLSSTVGRKRYNLMLNVPYSKSEFANRIMFSNINVTDAFTNGYRTFQGLAYKDYDKQYGAITKLISLGQNIFVVMEHGLGLVPVNPKALMQTTTGEAIHIYGYGVLPDEMTIISQDYGSKYEHSVIRTPIGIYGLDVDAKKVWRFSDKQGFQTISDMKIETYLKDYLDTLDVNVGLVDVRTHYNAKKGDIMFTFYTINNSDREAFYQDYFYVAKSKINLYLNNTVLIKCYTNLNTSDINITCSDNLTCSYEDNSIKITAIDLGEGTVSVNDEIKINVLVEESSEEPETTDTIELSRHNITLQLEQSYKLNVTTNGSSITWTSSNNDIVQVDNDGNLTAGNIVGSATITVSTGNVFDSCIVNTQSEPVAVNGVKINKNNIYVSPGDIFTLEAIVSPDYATNKNVIWSVPAGGNVFMTETPGTFRAGSNGVGYVTVKTEDGEYTTSCSVIIADNIPITKIEINPKSLTLYQGQTGQFNAIVYPEEATNKNIKWSVPQGAKAGVDQNGVVTAVRTGSSIVIAKSEDENVQSTALVTVLKNPHKRIVLDKNILSLKVGDTASVKADIYCEIDNLPVMIHPSTTAEITNTTIAKITGQTGEQYHIEALSRGTTQLIIKSRDDSSILAKCNINIIEDKLTLSTKDVTMYPGDTTTVTVYENKGDIIISSDNTNVSCSLVNNTITLTANNLGVTTFTITDNTSTEELVVTVTEVIPLEGLIFDKEIPDTITLTVGESFYTGFKYNPNNYTKSKSMVTMGIDNGDIMRAIRGERPQIIWDPELWGDSDALVEWKALAAGTTTGHLEVWNDYKIKDYAFNFKIIDPSVEGSTEGITFEEW